MIIRRVVGRSMEPGFNSGDVVIAAKKNFRNNDIVVALNPDGREIIKRIKTIDDAGIYLLGDNAALSTDSRNFGYIKSSDILGVVIMKLKFPKPTTAPEPVRRGYLFIPFVMAGVTLLMLLSQLYTADTFSLLFRSYGMGDEASKLAATGLIIAELMALPFWLRMRLSPLARAISSALGLLFPLYWLLFSLAPLKPENLGYLGTLLPITDSSLNSAIALILIGLSLVSFYVLNGKEQFKSLNKHKS